jgi:hypothetical protein
MRNKIDRRTSAGYKLRVYMDAIKEVKAMTDDMWMNSQILSDSRYMPKDVWIAYLEGCALAEAGTMIDYNKEAA